jgi:cytochrome c oxidase assembly protein subunit 15
MTQTPDNRWLHRFAVFTALATLCLIWVGGLVTSHGVGMAVPDWPTSYGYNMFYFPISKWVGGVFYEHTHRLMAVLVGALTSVLAAWLWCRETAGRARWRGLAVIVLLTAMLGHRGSKPAEGGLEGVPDHIRALAWVVPLLLAAGIAQAIRTRGALRWLGMTAFFAVILQGILGGFRVAQMMDALGIFHATLAQLFLVLVSAIALMTSRWWRRAAEQKLSIYGASRLRYVFAFVTGIVFAQLVIGASMRHQHAGLAISDFPTAYGKWWPATDADSIARYNRDRVEVTALNPITAAQVTLQMVHRVTALCIFGSVAWLAGAARSRFSAHSPVARLAALWFGAILLQVILGATTIWTNKAADIATAHVAVGALSLVLGALLTLVTWRVSGRMAAQGRESSGLCARIAPRNLTRALLAGLDHKRMPALISNDLRVSKMGGYWAEVIAHSSSPAPKAAKLCA